MAAGIKFSDQPPKKKKSKFSDARPKFLDKPPEQKVADNGQPDEEDYLGDDFAERIYEQGIRNAIPETGKALTRGAGTTVADVAHESRQPLSAREGSLPNLINQLRGVENEPVENYEWAEKLRGKLPERSEHGLFRGVERFGKIASRPEALVFGPAGIVGAALPAASGQVTEELGGTPEQQQVAEALSIFGPAAYGGSKAILNQPNKNTPKPPVQKAPITNVEKTTKFTDTSPKKVKSNETAPVEKVEPVVEFKTEKGSTYQVKGKSTERNKAKRKEHTDHGQQPKSEKTWYVSPEDATKLGEFQTSGSGKKIVEMPDGSLGVQYTSGKNKGKIEARTVVKPKDKPAKGLIPVESFENGEKIHFGNKITEVSSKATIRASQKPLTKKVKKPEPIPEPIIEKTGEGAAERLEYPKGTGKKLVEAVNTVIQAAKTPKQTFLRTTDAMNTAVFNYLAPLEKLKGGTNAVTSRIKLAQTAASEVNSVLENGIFSNMTGQFEHQGLKGAYGDLNWKSVSRDLKPSEGALADLDAYRTSKIALKRQKQGKKTGIDTEIAKEDAARLAPKYEKTSENIRNWQRAINNEYGKNILGTKLTEKFNDGYYASMYRVMDSGADSILQTGSLKPKQPFYNYEGSNRKVIPPSESDPYNAAMLIHNSRKNDAVLAYMDEVQAGRLPGKIRKGKNKEIPQNVRDEIGLDLDPELGEVAENLYNQTRTNGFLPDKNILRCWKDGKPIDIEVPSEVYDVFSNSVNQPLGPIAKIFSSVNRLFSKAISYEPRKAVSIFARDALSSLIYSKTGSNPISIFEALGDIYGNKEAYQKFKALGGDTYANRLATRTERTTKINDLITPGHEGIIVPFKKIASFFKKYPELINNMSMAVPYAEYKRGLIKFGDTPEGRIAAAMEAKKVTYDPNRKGSSKLVQGIGTFTPFWNVSLQDLSMVGKNLRNKSTWVKGLLGITLPTLMLLNYNDGNPDYDDLHPADKAAFWHFYSGENHYRVPIPWLLGTVFKVGAESFYNTIKSEAADGNQRAKEAWSGLYENFVSNLSGSLNPVVQMYIEQTTGKSPASPLGLALGVESNKAPEVVPRRLKDLPPELQYTSKTSVLARSFGSLWGISPIKIDKLIKGFGGLVATDALALTDEMAYWSGLAEDKRPEQNEKNYLMLGNFISDNTPTRTKYQNDFYEILDKQTKQKKAEKVVPEFGDPDILNVDLTDWNKDISGLFKDIREAEDDSSLSPAAKKKAIKELQQEINSLYKEAVTEYRNDELLRNK